jgi:hypothetical protein
VRYKSAAAFRRVLEEQLRQRSLESGQPLARLRKMAAFDRFLARLAKKEPEAWIVKGGFALQLRLGDRARTTKDIDVSATSRWTPEETIAHLRAAASLDLGEWFEFEVGEPVEAATGTPARGFRFPIRCLLDGRQFENFHLDVGYGDPVLEAPEVLTGPDLLAFAEIAPAKVRCYPLTTQVAEKLHTYTRICKRRDEPCPRPCRHSSGGVDGGIQQREAEAIYRSHISGQSITCRATRNA